MGQSCSSQHDDDKKPGHKIRKKATAAIGATYSSTAFGRLDDSGGLLQQMMGSIDEGYAYFSALACQPASPSTEPFATDFRMAHTPHRLSW